MTTATIERAEQARWIPHAHVRKFTADNERDAMHTLFPQRARIVDSAAKCGQLHRVPQLLVPHVTGDMMESLGMEPYATADEDGNILANAGIFRMLQLLIGAGGQAYDNTHSAIGVGDNGAAASETQTDLSAAVNAANRYFQMSDPTYPSVTAQTVTFQSTFSTANALFAWAEWAIDQHTASGATASVAPMLNRKATALGTKTSAAAWVFRVTITIA